MSETHPNPPAEQPRYITVVDVLFELFAAGLLCAGCAYLSFKLFGWLGGFLIGVCGVPLWVAFRYAQDQYATRQRPNKPRL